MTWRRGDFSVDSDSPMAHQRSVMHRVLPLNFRGKRLRQFVQQNHQGEMFAFPPVWNSNHISGFGRNANQGKNFTQNVFRDERKLSVK